MTNGIRVASKVSYCFSGDHTVPTSSNCGRRVQDVLVSPYVHEHGIRVASKVSYYCSGDHIVALPLETGSSTIGRLSKSLCSIDLVAPTRLPRNRCRATVAAD